MKVSALSIFLIIIIIIAIIAYFIISKLMKVEIREIVLIPPTSKEAYLDVSFTYPEFTNLSSNYYYMFYLQNNFQHNLELDISSRFELLLENSRIVIDEEKITENLAPKVRKRYDINFENVFDNSIINGLNFCERERKVSIDDFLESRFECYKGDTIGDGICWFDCRIYKLDFFEKRRNLYCQVSPVVITSISYSTTINGTAEIAVNSYEDRIRWNVRDSPINIYLRPSPLPFSTLLPLSITFEVEGYNILLKKIRVEVVKYSIEVESFFEKRIESIETLQNCEIDVNRFINGRTYLGKEKSCTIGPFEIKIEKISKNKKDIISVNREEIDKLVKSVCKDYIVNESVDIEGCSKELIKKGYLNICSVYGNLEICRIGEEKLNRIILLISVEIEKREDFRKSLVPQFC